MSCQGHNLPRDALQTPSWSARSQKYPRRCDARTCAVMIVPQAAEYKKSEKRALNVIYRRSRHNSGGCDPPSEMCLRSQMRSKRSTGRRCSYIIRYGDRRPALSMVASTVHFPIIRASD